MRTWPVIVVFRLCCTAQDLGVKRSDVLFVLHLEDDVWGEEGRDAQDPGNGVVAVADNVPDGSDDEQGDDSDYERALEIRSGFVAPLPTKFGASFACRFLLLSGVSQRVRCRGDAFLGCLVGFVRGVCCPSPDIAIVLEVCGEEFSAIAWRIAHLWGWGDVDCGC